MNRFFRVFLVSCFLIFILLSCAGEEKVRKGGGAEPIDVARDLADTWISTYSPEDASWSWDSGVLMLGIWELYLQTGEKKYRDYVRDWLDYHIKKGYVIAFNDHVLPALVALKLWQKTGEYEYFKVVQDARDYIFLKASRTNDGGINHMGWISGNQLWVDTLFMITPFLMELGSATNDSQCFDEAVKQFEVFSNHLRDADTGLYRHMYDADTGEVMPPVADYWGRGNAWVVAASGIALGFLPEEHDGYEGILSRFIQQANSMGNLLDSSGRWHTIMNRPDTYLETSAGLITAYGIYKAAQAGLADEDILQIADKAFAGGMNQIVVDKNEGTLLLGTSYGTSPSTWEMYQYVLKGEQVSYGVGAFILAAVARAEHGIDSKVERGSTDETYIEQPSSDDPVEWGYFYLARGNLSKSHEKFEKAIEFNQSNTQALFGSSLVETIDFALDALDLYNRYSVGSAYLYELLSFIGSDAREFGKRLSDRMKVVEQDFTFVRAPERIVISTGGSTAVGAVELDLGEAYFLDAIGLLLWGAGDMVSALSASSDSQVFDSFVTIGTIRASEKLDSETAAEALDHIAAALGVLADGIAEIDSEPDNQSDDLLPANFFRLEGTFHIPGILLPTPVEDVWAMFGINPRELFGDGPMPQAIIDWLLNMKELVELLRDLIAGIGDKHSENMRTEATG